MSEKNPYTFLESVLKTQIKSTHDHLKYLEELVSLIEKDKAIIASTKNLLQKEKS